MNWDNENCRKAIYQSAMRFWLDRGIDGFRVDTVNKYSKFLDFPDAPVTDLKSYIQPAPQFWCNGPRIHEFIKEMKCDVLDQYRTHDDGPIVTVGELSLTPDPKDVLKYVSASSNELSMVFQFDMLRLGMGTSFEDKYDFAPWRLSEMKKIATRWQTFIESTDGWTTVFNENHDSGRSISKFGNDDPKWRDASAKMLAIMLTTQTGTLFLYQGQEIGMVNAPRIWGIEEYKDIEGLGYYAEATRLSEAGVDPTRQARIMRGLQLLARDHARLPMQWTSGRNAGFSTGTPWMRAHDNHGEVNVAAQTADPDSVLEFYRRLLALRREHRDVFVYGNFQLLDPEGEETFMFLKEHDDRSAVVALNFTDRLQPLQVKLTQDVNLLLSSYKEPLTNVLQPYEGRIYTDY